MCHNVLPYERTRIHLAPSDRLPLIRRHEQAGTSHLEDKKKTALLLPNGCRILPVWGSARLLASTELSTCHTVILCHLLSGALAG